MQVTHYKFSIAWSRLLPNGTLKSRNQKGITYYKSFLSALRAAGITPAVTLYSNDLPQALQDEGGWSNNATVKRFEEYTNLCLTEFGSMVRISCEEKNTEIIISL